MKKYLSVFTLVARESIFRLTLLWVLSAIAQTVSFVYALDYRDVRTTFDFERLFTNDGVSISIIFAITLFVTGLMLAKTGFEFRTKQGYTLRRLRIDEKKVFLTQSAYNALMLFMLIMAETVLAFIFLTAGHMQIEEKYVTNQSVYLNFYSCSFVQNLFCGRDILRIVRNIFCVISLGLSLGAFTHLGRRNKKFIPAIILLVCFCAVFLLIPGISDWSVDVIILIAAVAMIVWSLLTVLKRGKEYDA